MLWHLTKLYRPKEISRIDISCSVSFDAHDVLHPDIDKSTVNRDWLVHLGHYVDTTQDYVKGYGYNTETKRYYEVLFTEHGNTLRILTYVEFDSASLGSIRVTQGSSSLMDQYLYGLVVDTFEMEGDSKLLDSVQYAVSDFLERADPKLATPYQKHMYTADEAYEFGLTAIDLMKFSDHRSKDLYDLHRSVNSTFHLLPFMRTGMCSLNTLHNYFDGNLIPITGIPIHNSTNPISPYERISIEIPYGHLTYSQNNEAYINPFVLANIVKGMDTLINDIECTIQYYPGIEGPQVTLHRFIPYVTLLSLEQIVRYMTNLWFTNILGVETLHFKVTPNEELIMTGLVNSQIVFHIHADLAYLKCQNLHLTYPPF